jgi:hypothetical protein
LRLWHLASLDAPTVAIVWSLAFAWSVHVTLPLWLPTVLGLSALSFYIADRLMDARKAMRGLSGNTRAVETLRERHYFHWRHRRTCFPVAIAAAIAAFTLVLHSMPLAARERNSVLAAAALAYFTSVHNPWRIAESVSSPRFRLRLPKELLVGILFTLACAGPAWARTSGHCWDLLLPTIGFAALAWLNCHAIETWESAATSASIFAPAISLALAAFAASLALVPHTPRSAALLAAAAVSALLLALLDRQRPTLTPIALRSAADLVLLTPIALLVMQ